MPVPEYTDYGDYIEICTWFNDVNSEKGLALVQKARNTMTERYGDAWSSEDICYYTDDGTQIVEKTTNFPVMSTRYYAIK